MALFKPKAQAEARQEGAGKKSLWREYGEALIIALILALVIRAFVIQAFSIPSGSMIPTLLVGDYLLVNKFVYGIRNPFTNQVWIPLGTPQRWDILVFIFPQDPSKDYIKRVAALPGEKVQIINKKLYINDQHVETPHAVNTDEIVLPPQSRPMDSPRDNYGPVVVPKDSYFVLGDNRDHSYDSRFWGFVSMEAVRGKAFIIYFSWDGDHSVPVYAALGKGMKGLFTDFSWDGESFKVRWSRIGQLIR
jgi:signal peptidase I